MGDDTSTVAVPRTAVLFAITAYASVAVSEVDFSRGGQPGEVRSKV